MKKLNVKLDYYEPLNKFTESGYYDTRSVIQRQEIIEGTNNFEIFEKFYKLNNSLRYCNGSYYKFNSLDWQEKFNNWTKSDDYKKKSFSLYYGGGVVD